MSRKILRDVPVSEDLFSGHGHKRTASALAKTIKEFGNDTCAIGLEGKWGAGKSTIIELARKELDSDKNEKNTGFSLSTFGPIKHPILSGLSWKHC